MPILYSAVERFGPAHGELWRKYIDWSGLTHLREVVSLDGILCPSIIQDLTDEDWQHNVKKDYKVILFYDLDYLIRRVGEPGQINILALLQDPTEEELQSFRDGRFVFRGFDLVELQTGISALVNCGGFDKAFAGSDLSECGLLTDYAQALAVQKRLRDMYPDEPHAGCDLWAIWQLRSSPENKTQKKEDTVRF